jgi:acetyl-CoA carboxylase biotin carboxylase subunit
MFDKILIANRGEIALRVICACKELGIRTVAVYSEADRHSLHVRFADEAVCIGPPRAAESYLNIPAVISAAEITDVDAIHPGYGFLSENANFAEVCETCGIKFIGPSPDMIRLMGEKDRAREAMRKAGVPVLPGSFGAVKSAAEGEEIAAQIGYPVILKAVAGGGGRGMRVVNERSALADSFAAAQHEAGVAFGSGALYIEKSVQRPCHIEFQVLGDSSGRVIHLGERDCTVQRRHQKLIEESPSPRMTPELRADLGGRVVKALEQLGYTSAGTVEFLLDLDSGKMHFIEMNTRIQVEHPVTEMVTNIDLVKSQIQLAAGDGLEKVLEGSNNDGNGGVALWGHTIECRINAEDPNTFIPSCGRVATFHPPGGTGVRVDTAAYPEYVITPYYDSLIAKLIVRGRDRQESLSRMARSLEMFIVEGVQTSIPLHRRIMADPDFRSGAFDTNFIPQLLSKPAAQ